MLKSLKTDTEALDKIKNPQLKEQLNNIIIMTRLLGYDVQYLLCADDDKELVLGINMYKISNSLHTYMIWTDRDQIIEITEGKIYEISTKKLNSIEQLLEKLN